MLVTMEQYIETDFLKEIFEKSKNVLESLNLPNKWTYNYGDEGCHETLRSELTPSYDIIICPTNDIVCVRQSINGRASLFSSTITNFDHISFIEQINNLGPNFL